MGIGSGNVLVFKTQVSTRIKSLERQKNYWRSESEKLIARGEVNFQVDARLMKLDGELAQLYWVMETADELLI